MDIRENIRVAETPFLWSTNLSDDEVRSIYTQHLDAIREPDPEPSTPGVIRIRLRLAFLDFADGVCLWTASGDHHTVLYRSYKDLELWNARRAEIEELHQEQTAEAAAERQLVTSEDHHLKELTENSLAAGDYSAAAAHIMARAELRRNFSNLTNMPVRWTYWDPDLLLARFKSSQYGIQFFQRYRCKPQAFTNFAHWFAQLCGLEGTAQSTEIRRIYESALNLFPDNPHILKAFCLYWRRIGDYDEAKRICIEAITKGIKDGTVSGFEGRLLRLEKEMRKKSAQPGNREHP